MFKIRSSSSILRNVKNIIIKNNNVICNKNIIKNNYSLISSLSTLTYNSNNNRNSKPFLRNVRQFSVVTEPLESLGKVLLLTLIAIFNLVFIF
jgi:hypothetical protein